MLPHAARFGEIPRAALERAAPPVVAALYRQAFDLYGPQFLWSTRKMTAPSISDALDTAARLKREGNMASRRFAENIEEACRAAI